jgi:hypothetical protein
MDGIYAGGVPLCCWCRDIHIACSALWTKHQRCMSTQRILPCFLCYVCRLARCVWVMWCLLVRHTARSTLPPPPLQHDKPFPMLTLAVYRMSAGWHAACG